MRKTVIGVLLALFILTCFCGCTQGSDNKAGDSQNETASQADPTEVSVDENLITTEIAEKPVEDAKITSEKAIDMIKSFSAEKLGLDGKTDDYRFMVSTKGKTIGGEDYIEVIACTVNEKQKDGSVDIDTKGSYYVSYDGSKMLVRNSKTGNFSDLK